MSEYSHLWNDLPFEERERLQPFMMEVQMRHLEQAKQKAIIAHKTLLGEFNRQISSIQGVLDARNHDR